MKTSKVVAYLSNPELPMMDTAVPEPHQPGVTQTFIFHTISVQNGGVDTALNLTEASNL